MNEKGYDYWLDENGKNFVVSINHLKNLGIVQKDNEDSKSESDFNDSEDNEDSKSESNFNDNVDDEDNENSNFESECGDNDSVEIRRKNCNNKSYAVRFIKDTHFTVDDDNEIWMNISTFQLILCRLNNITGQTWIEEKDEILYLIMTTFREQLAKEIS